MIGTAQATIQLKDLWSSKASSIAKSTDKMEKAISNFEKRFGRVSESYKKYGRDIGSFQKKYKELAQLPKIRLSNIIDTTLQKPIAEVEKLKRKLKEPTGKTFLQEAQEEAKKLEKELNEKYQLELDAYNGEILRLTMEFNAQRELDIKNTAALRINVDPRFQHVIDMFITPEN